MPEDKHVIKGIREIFEKGGPRNADHTLNNIDSFNMWSKKLAEASERKAYYPDLSDTVSSPLKKRKLHRISSGDTMSQMHDAQERELDVDAEAITPDIDNV